jgi:Ca2+-binding RTX toxin-like protein
MSFSTSVYPYDCVCYVIATFPDGTSFQGSGAIIGPHTVLTASHLLWRADGSESAASVTVYPGFNAGGSSIPGQWVDHFYQVNNAGGVLSTETSQTDFAIIDVSTDLTPYGYFGTSANYSGGVVHLTGYPSSANGIQSDQFGRVLKDPSYAVLDYSSVSASPGASGGPVWIEQGSQAYVVGVVSTSGWAVQLTSADIATINNWETGDAYLWTPGSLLHASEAAASIGGGAGNDTITGWSGADTLFGGAGLDSIVGGAGFNQVNGNTGDDTILGHSAVGDWLLGGQGNDSIDASASTGANIINGNLGADTLVGGSGPDSLRGGQGDDLIRAGSGADWLSGDLGNNTIYGGQGADTFRAGPGHDYVNGWHQGDHVQVAAGVTYVAAQVSADVRITFSNGGEMDLLNTQSQTLQPGWIGS